MVCGCLPPLFQDCDCEDYCPKCSAVFTLDVSWDQKSIGRPEHMQDQPVLVTSADLVGSVSLGCCFDPFVCVFFVCGSLEGNLVRWQCSFGGFSSACVLILCTYWFIARRVPACVSLPVCLCVDWPAARKIVWTPKLVSVASRDPFGWLLSVYFHRSVESCVKLECVP